MPTILVVDDSLTDRRVISSLLHKVPGNQVLEAVDGEEALQRLAHDPPDLVLTDLMMPNVDGLELVAQVVEKFPLIPIILMTGRGSEEIAVNALRAGASSYVPKNEISTLLVQTVDNVLRVAQGERNHARLMESMTNNVCSFKFNNDDSIIAPLINYLHRSILSIGLCDERETVRVCVAIEEAVRNAMHHGNLELSSDLREQDTNSYQKLYEERRELDPYRDRIIRVDISVGPNEGRFVINDEGPGFDPDSLPDPTDLANLEKATGRGLLLMRTFMDEVSFNSAGNQVTMIKRATKDSNAQA